MISIEEVNLVFRFSCEQRFCLSTESFAIKMRDMDNG